MYRIAEISLSTSTQFMLQQETVLLVLVTSVCHIPTLSSSDNVPWGYWLQLDSSSVWTLSMNSFKEGFKTSLLKCTYVQAPLWSLALTGVLKMNWLINRWLMIINDVVMTGINVESEQKPSQLISTSASFTWYIIQINSTITALQWSNLDDTADITWCHNKLVTQVNNVLCSFSHFDAIVRIKLLKSYCLSLYGCEIWNSNHGITSIGKLCRS